MASASQQHFTLMLREHIAPALRAHGLKGSGRSYALPHDDVWALLGFQSSTSSGPGGIKFTVNCKVVRKDVWAAAHSARPHLGSTPKPNVGAGPFEWWRRIGELMPDRQDRWWVLPVGEPPEERAREVLGAIVDVALPAMRKQVGRQVRAGFADPFADRA